MCKKSYGAREANLVLHSYQCSDYVAGVGLCDVSIEDAYV